MRQGIWRILVGNRPLYDVAVVVYGGCGGGGDDDDDEKYGHILNWKLFLFPFCFLYHKALRG